MADENKDRDDVLCDIKESWDTGPRFDVPQVPLPLLYKLADDYQSQALYVGGLGNTRLKLKILKELK